MNTSANLQIVSRETLKSKINLDMYDLYTDNEKFFGIKIKGESSYFAFSSDNFQIRESDTVIEIRSNDYYLTIFKDVPMVYFHAF